MRRVSWPIADLKPQVELVDLERSQKGLGKFAKILRRPWNKLKNVNDKKRVFRNRMISDWEKYYGAQHKEFC